MAHALGEMYYLASLMEERRQKLEKEHKREEKEGPHVHSGLVFISPRVSKEFDTVVPSDTGKPNDAMDDWCVIA